MNRIYYIHILSVCPTGWRCPTDLTVRIGRLAVETGMFPLYEVENGKYKLSLDLPHLRPVSDYMKLQGRFRHLSEEVISEIQQRVKTEYDEKLANLKQQVASITPPPESTFQELLDLANKEFDKVKSTFPGVEERFKQIEDEIISKMEKTIKDQF